MMHEETEDDSGSLRARRCIDAVIAHGSADDVGAGERRRFTCRTAVAGVLIAALVVGVGIVGIRELSKTQHLPRHTEGPHAYSKQENSLMSKNLVQNISGGAVALGLLAAAVPAGDACAQAAVEWRVADGGNGHWYEGVVLSSSSGVSWETARQAAQARGADLASLPTESLRNWVSVTFLADEALWSGVGVGPWLGGFQITGSAEPAAGWTWVDGTPFVGDGPWASGEPNDATHCNSGNENHVHCAVGSPLLVNDAGLTGLGDCGGGIKSAIIEWSADCNADGIVDYGQIRSGDLADANANNIPDCCEQGTSCDPCVGDIDSSGFVNSVDLAMILTVWGTSGGSYPSADIDHDGIVAGADLGIMLTMWGNCP